MKRVVTIVVAALALFAAGAVLGLREKPAPMSSSTLPARPDRLAQTIERAQQRLRELPGDHRTWAELGLAYVEQARITADPSRYPLAETALRRSLTVKATDNSDALTGLGALANARHEFAQARTFAQRALRANPFDASAYGVLADAETQLGRATQATAAIQRMLDLRPGLAAYARGSYDLEQRGRLTEATRLMQQALNAAVDPADIAFCRSQLGDLAWFRGDLTSAQAEYDAGLAADPSFATLLRGRARIAASTGNLAQAVTDTATIAARTPTPETLSAYGEMLRLAGRDAEAFRQLDLAVAAHRLFVANGGRDDLTAAQLALAQGRPSQAVTAAQSEWRRRPFAEVADVLAQALHAAGRDSEARPYAEKALAASPHNAAFAFHLAQTQLALGDQAAARLSLTKVRALNPYFSPSDGPVAARLLTDLEAQP
ncbi:tetratricopeptide repeat protein [Actinoplanes sp. LDG1-06]|uniref:Tetratricopeptide repeat protein n=1 Tax=Paractinoplanes ovalisporus TaxID=2810368 RepID=A0ABS2AK90_9ACTN|nr:tetratricopeptide repeat protein [Actinoplanes ovalisporus]MBM2620259.1 tetratricopeptide repeat protein [Actinoplanes ovalisporus]